MSVSKHDLYSTLDDTDALTSLSHGSMQNCGRHTRRVADAAQGGDLLPFVSRYLERVAMGKVAGSALEAKQWGYLRVAERGVSKALELPDVAKHESLALFEGGYRSHRGVAGGPAGNRTRYGRQSFLRLGASGDRHGG